MKNISSRSLRALSLLIACCAWIQDSHARVGGAGGHNSHSSSSGSHSYSGGGFGYSSSGGGDGLNAGHFFIVLIVVIVVMYLKSRSGKKSSSLLGGLSDTVLSDGNDDEDEAYDDIPAGSKNFPEGLTPQKITTSFMELQMAWQLQDLGKVRQWMSDGVYQRFTAQFAMMKKLQQKNRLSNIRIVDISAANRYNDGAYESADIAITFSMNDEFICGADPSLNESYEGDRDTEYWTFIRRKDTTGKTADLYSSTNCPNCGAALENHMGEVSRCSSCKTLTNNAAYDWVLNEITQDEDYSPGNRLLHDNGLRDLVKNDPLFSIQRIEDIASNVFMQMMEVWSGDHPKKLSRFATKEAAVKILQQKEENGRFVFNRLYTNEVTLTGYDTQQDQLHLSFNITASYQRVQTGDKLRMMDRDIREHRFHIVLSKNLAALQTPQKEIAFSYECANCGAPYDDTTNDTCSYCDAPVVDTAKNWVLIDFAMRS